MNEERKPSIENMLSFWSRDMRSIAVYDQRGSFSFRQSDRGALVWFSCREPAFLLLSFFSGGEWMVIYFTEGENTNYSAKMSGGKMNVAHFWIITNMLLFILLSLFSPVIEWPLTNICCNSETCLPTNKWLTEWRRESLTVCVFCYTTHFVN